MHLEDYLYDLEEELLSPEVRRDAMRLRTLLAPEFREFGSSGRTYSRDEIVAALQVEQQGESPLLSLVEFSLVASERSWALVTYCSLRHDTSGRLVGSTLRSSTWILRDGRWQLLFHQGTAEELLIE